MSKDGISLVEMAISVTAVGLLIAATLSGVSMLKASKLRKLVTEFTTYKQTIEEFEAEYHYLPGDLVNASSYWSGADNGDGDGIVDWDGAVAAKQEDLYAWDHIGIGRAELIRRDFTGDVVGAGTVRYGIGATINTRNSDAFPSMAFVFYSLPATVYGKFGVQLGASRLAADGRPTVGGLIAKDAYSIDVKLDDGKASEGQFYTYREAADSGCTDNAYTSASAVYDLDATDKTCQLLFWYKRL